MGEDGGHGDVRQVFGAGPLRLAGRMDGVGEQRQHIHRGLSGGHHHGCLPTAIGVPAGDQRALGQAAAQLDRFDDAGPVGGR
ncbi:hypothetical protein MMEU_4353 [Mycobacterium marinum str. Europe]|nr:hypothetical protein MMEU_4353 [Mycobacterium marinum str. Europe]